MDVEIVFSGLCSFLNVYDNNPTMGEPGVILIRADRHHHDNGEPAEHDHDHGEPEEHDHEASGEPGGGVINSEDIHIPFIAFDTGFTQVNDPTGFTAVDDRPEFVFMTLDGEEISIEGHQPAVPQVNDSFEQVLRKDDYWPEAKNQWNRDLVPERGQKPKASAVAAFMRFGSGLITAQRLSSEFWSFSKPGLSAHVGRFAEEVSYSGFPLSDNDELRITLTHLETGTVRTLVFSSIDPEAEVLTIFIGNNTDDGMDEALDRQPSKPDEPRHGRHVSILDRVANPDLGTSNREAKPVPPLLGFRKGGGGSGYCGPGSANGGKTTTPPNG